MKYLLIISILILSSCVSGSLYIENPVGDQENNSSNYVAKDLGQQISDSLLISFDHSVNDKPLFFNDQMLLLTSSGHSFIYAIDPEYNDVIETSSLRLNQGSRIGPVRYKNFVLFALGSGRENLQLYDLKSASFVWKIRIPFGIDSRPIIIDDYIYVASMNGLVIKLFFGDGSEQWRLNTGSHITADLNTDANLIYAVTNQSKLFAINTSDGSVKWKVDVAKQAAYSQPLILNNKVIVSTIGGDVRAFNKSDGSELWSRQIAESIYGNMAADDRYIYFGTNGEHLYKLDQLGETAWTFQSRGIINAQPLIGRENIYFGSGAGYFYVLNKDDASLIWSKQYDGRIVSSPAFWRDKLLVFSDNDDIYELRSFSR